MGWLSKRKKSEEDEKKEKLIKEGKLNEIPRIKFYYIDIFNESGRVRKTPDQICEEIVGIINKED